MVAKRVNIPSKRRMEQPTSAKIERRRDTTGVTPKGSGKLPANSRNAISFENPCNNIMRAINTRAKNKGKERSLRNGFPRNKKSFKTVVVKTIMPLLIFSTAYASFSAPVRILYLFPVISSLRRFSILRKV